MQTNSIVIAIFLFIIIFMAYQGLKSQKNQDQIKIEKIKIQQDLDLEEEQFITDAIALLHRGPVAVIKKLLEKFTWEQLLECYGLGTISIELLRTIETGVNLTLPNTTGTHLNADEIRIIRKARNLAHAVNDEFDIQSWNQEPTTINLKKLVDKGLVTVDFPIDNNRRSYTVQLTSAGFNLQRIDRIFSYKQSRFEPAKNLFRLMKSRDRISTTLNSFLREEHQHK